MIHRTFIPKVVIGLVIGVALTCIMPAWYAPAKVSAQEIEIGQNYYLTMTEFSPDKADYTYLRGDCTTTVRDPNIVIECNEAKRETTGSFWKVTFTLVRSSKQTGGWAIQNTSRPDGTTDQLTGPWTLWSQATGTSSMLITQTELMIPTVTALVRRYGSLN